MGNLLRHPLYLCHNPNFTLTHAVNREIAIVAPAPVKIQVRMLLAVWSFLFSILESMMSGMESLRLFIFLSNFSSMESNLLSTPSNLDSMVLKFLSMFLEREVMSSFISVTFSVRRSIAISNRSPRFSMFFSFTIPTGQLLGLKSPLLISSNLSSLMTGVSIFLSRRSNPRQTRRSRPRWGLLYIRKASSCLLVRTISSSSYMEAICFLYN